MLPEFYLSFFLTICEQLKQAISALHILNKSFLIRTILVVIQQSFNQFLKVPFFSVLAKLYTKYFAEEDSGHLDCVTNTTTGILDLAKVIRNLTVAKVIHLKNTILTFLASK